MASVIGYIYLAYARPAGESPFVDLVIKANTKEEATRIAVDWYSQMSCKVRVIDHGLRLEVTFPNDASVKTVEVDLGMLIG